MLKTIQIIALIQGLFLIFVLLKKRNTYKKVTFWLFLGSIISVIFFLIGDDYNNLFSDEVDWFLFDNSLFITFLFLFFRYFKSEKLVFEKKDYLFFIPNITYFIIEFIEVLNPIESFFIEISELLIEFTFLFYLMFILYNFFKAKSKFWILYFIIPIVLIMSINYVNDLTELLGFDIAIEKKANSYLVLVIAFLFYFITFYIISKPKEFLPIAKIKEYKTSSLKPELIEDYKKRLIDSMEIDKLYENSKLSIHLLSEKLNIPRQYLSEVLNLHLNINFHDFINKYRVEAFAKKLENDQYNHFTLFGIANEVGFNSKSSFNATFKKNKGLTPSQYKNSLLKK